MTKIKYNLKKKPEELQQYIMFKHRHNIVANKKGKGSYNRKKDRGIFYE